MALFGSRRRYIEGGDLTGLLTRIKDLTSIQSEDFLKAEEGKWAQVAGTVIDASRNDDSISVSIVVEVPDSAIGRQVFLLFHREDPGAIILFKDGLVTVQGRISGQIFGDVMLKECEVVSHKEAGDIAFEKLRQELNGLKESSKERSSEFQAFASESRAWATEQIALNEEARREQRNVSDKPRLPDAALRAWFEAFKLAYPTGTKDLAEKSAVGAFPNHHVARSRVRELFPNAQRGRPKKNNDLEKSPENDGE